MRTLRSLVSDEPPPKPSGPYWPFLPAGGGAERGEAEIFRGGRGVNNMKVEIQAQKEKEKHLTLKGFAST